MTNDITETEQQPGQVDRAEDTTYLQRIVYWGICLVDIGKKLADILSKILRENLRTIVSKNIELLRNE